jgi:hypothetical protein
MSEDVEAIVIVRALRFDLNDSTQLADFLSAAFEHDDPAIYDGAMDIAARAAIRIHHRRKLP